MSMSHPYLTHVPQKYEPAGYAPGADPFGLVHVARLPQVGLFHFEEVANVVQETATFVVTAVGKVFAAAQDLGAELLVFRQFVNGPVLVLACRQESCGENIASAT